MKHIRTLSLGIGLAVVIPSAVTYANEDLEAREQAATARISNSAIIAEQAGRYHQARERAVSGNQSTAVRTTEWLARMQAWIEQWTFILAFTDLKENLPYDAFQSRLASFLEAQTQELASLQDEAVKIRAAADEAATLLTTREQLPSDLEPGYQTVVSALRDRQSTLRATLNELGSVPTNKLQDLARVEEVSRRGIRARVQAALIARAQYPLQKALADVDALLLAEKTVDPALLKLEAAFTAMNRYNASLAYFHAVEAIEPARTQCAEVKAALQALPQQAYVRAAKTKADRYCSGIENLYQGLTGDTSVGHAEYVQAYLGEQKTKIKQVCLGGVNATNAPACEKLAVLASIPEAKIAAMGDAELRFVELGWSDSMDRASGN